jgi:RNA polymerase sigma factor (sigma-70 family)
MKPYSPSQENSDDKLIWQLFLSGDAAAFEKLMSIHFRTLFHYGCKFSRDQEFVKDSIQDLFMHLWEKRAGLNAEAVVKPYLMASLRRLMHRNVASRSWISEGNTERADDTFEIEFSVEQQYIQNESTLVRTLRLEKLLIDLPKRQKEVIYLKFFQELTREQISEIMAVSPQTVSNLLQIAIKQLKKHWKAEFLTLVLIHFFSAMT